MTSGGTRSERSRSEHQPRRKGPDSSRSRSFDAAQSARSKSRSGTLARDNSQGVSRNGFNEANMPKNCVCGPNIYGRLLGPTVDEQILAGLAVLFQMCDECPQEPLPASATEPLSMSISSSRTTSPIIVLSPIISISTVEESFQEAEPYASVQSEATVTTGTPQSSLRYQPSVQEEETVLSQTMYSDNTRSPTMQSSQSSPPASEESVKPESRANTLASVKESPQPSPPVSEEFVKPKSEATVVASMKESKDSSVETIETNHSASQTQQPSKKSSEFQTESVEVEVNVNILPNSSEESQTSSEQLCVCKQVPGTTCVPATCSEVQDSKKHSSHESSGHSKSRELSGHSKSLEPSTSHQSTHVSSYHSAGEQEFGQKKSSHHEPNNSSHGSSHKGSGSSHQSPHHSSSHNLANSHSSQHKSDHGSKRLEPSQHHVSGHGGSSHHGSGHHESSHHGSRTNDSSYHKSGHSKSSHNIVSGHGGSGQHKSSHHEFGHNKSSHHIVSGHGGSSHHGSGHHESSHHGSRNNNSSHHGSGHSKSSHHILSRHGGSSHHESLHHGSGHVGSSHHGLEHRKSSPHGSGHSKSSSHHLQQKSSEHGSKHSFRPNRTKKSASLCGCCTCQVSSTTSSSISGQKMKPALKVSATQTCLCRIGKEADLRNKESSTSCPGSPKGQTKIKGMNCYCQFDSESTKESSTSCTSLTTNPPCKTKQVLKKSVGSCKCEHSKSENIRKKVTVCGCDGCTTTSTSTSTSDNYCYKKVNKPQSGDFKSFEIKYAITKITKFSSYTTFEVMKSTKKKPRVMPTKLEGVFVLKNRKCN